MNKKIFNFLSSFGVMALGVFLILFCTVSFSSAESQDEVFWQFPQAGPRQQVNLVSVSESLPLSSPLAPKLINTPGSKPDISAFAAVAVDANTQTELFAQESDKIRPLASITKLMTTLVLLDLPLKWNEEITVLDADCDSTSHHIEPGEIYTRSDLWEAALIGSANGAVRALVRTSGLSGEDFVARMNKKAHELNLLSLSFAEPTGLSSGNAGNAKDVARLLSYALKQDKAKRALGSGSKLLMSGNGQERVVWSTNRLLTGWTENNFNKKTIFGKTGYISDARYNFVFQVGDAHPIIVVVLGAVSDEARFEEGKAIAEWVFNNYFWE